MQREIEDIINTLLGVDENNEPLTIPDGVIDRSHIADILATLTHDGRAFKSDEPAALARAIGSLVKRSLASTPMSEVGDVVLVLSMLPTLIVRAVQKLCPTVCPEEIFMVAFDQHDMDQLRLDLKATPYYEMPDGRLVPDFHAHHLLAAPFVIDDRVKHHFVRRHITPIHYAAQEDVWPDIPEIEIVDTPEFGTKSSVDTPEDGISQWKDCDRLVACPLEGFDEFFEFFDQHDYKLWASGVEIYNLPPFSSTDDRRT
jgi:hypothetical protein